MRTLLRRAVLLTVGLAGLATLAPAYYHWTFFVGRSGPFQPLKLKFDLNKLPGSSVSYFLPKAGPAKMVDGDNYTALVSQIRRAAEAWNVGESALKVQFGGFTEKKLTNAEILLATPAIDVVFDDDMPPGVLAYTEPFTHDNLSYLAQKDAPNFVPILRSRLQLRGDLAAYSQASYSHGVFQTLVHEFGHTLGLQHSLTSGAMATSATRHTSKTQPVTADDIAGLAALYPTVDFTASTGTIAGHVSAAGKDANLVSVVALSADGTAIGGMTLPDGSYRIEGLAPGEYVVYAHPLPPALEGEREPAGLVLPEDVNGQTFAPALGFQTRFFPNTKDWKEATKVKVEAARTADKIDFSLASTGGGLSYLRLFTWVEGQSLLSPTVPSKFQYWTLLSALGSLVPDTLAMTPGLKVDVVGEAATLDQLQKYPNDPDYRFFMLAYLKTAEVTHPTPVAITMSTGNDLVVLPRAFTVVPTEHPLLTAVEPVAGDNGQRIAKVTGKNLSAATRVLFDGAEARSVRQEEDGSLLVAPPAGVSEYQAVVEAVSPNGQSSRQVQFLEALRRFAYDNTVDPWYALTPANVTAGTDVMVTIDAGNTNFLAGKTALGFGTSDVIVRQLWVVSPTRLLANLTIKPEARLGDTPMTISTGLQLVTYGVALQIRPAAEGQNSLHAPVVDEATGLAGAPAGATIVMRTTSAPASATGWSLRIGDILTTVTRSDDGLLRAQVPNGLAPGPQIVELYPTSGSSIPPVLMQVNESAPQIVLVEGPAPAETLAPLLAGDRVMLLLKNLAEGGLLPAAADVDVRVAGAKQSVSVIEELVVEPGAARLFKVEFHVSPLTAVANDQAVTLRIGTRLSNAVTISVVAPLAPASFPKR